MACTETEAAASARCTYLLVLSVGDLVMPWIGCHFIPRPTAHLPCAADAAVAALRTPAQRAASSHLYAEFR